MSFQNTLRATVVSFPEEGAVTPTPMLQVVKQPEAPQADSNVNREAYFQRVCQFLLRMNGSEWIELSSMVGSPVIAVSDKKPHFIDAVKRFIDEGRDWYHFGNVYFNDAYTHIYKCEVNIYLRAKKGDS